jgi:ankyrin repeat protein
MAINVQIGQRVMSKTIGLRLDPEIIISETEYNLYRAVRRQDSLENHIALLRKEGHTIADHDDFALRLAAAFGNERALDELLALHDNMNVNTNGCLVVASGTGQLDMVKKLIGAGAPANAGNDSPLCIAAKNGRLSVVEYLLTIDTVNGCARDGEPLISASSGGFDKIVRMLAPMSSRQQLHLALRTGVEKGQQHAVSAVLDFYRPDSTDFGLKTIAIRNGDVGITSRLYDFDMFVPKRTHLPAPAPSAPVAPSAPESRRASWWMRCFGCDS